MTATNYIWDFANDSYLMEKEDSGATTAVYTNEPVQYGKLVSQCRGSTASYYHFDGLGSTRTLTDHSGNVTDTHEYSAWGQEVANSGNTTNPFWWIGVVGYHLDAPLASYYIRARTYSQYIGRWLSGDPYRFIDGLNLYLYTSDNPIIRYDPSGLFIFVGGIPPLMRLCRPTPSVGPRGPFLPPIAQGPKSSPPPKPKKRKDMDPTEFPPGWDPKWQNAQPPGRCTTSQHNALRRIKDAACDNLKACKLIGWSCTDLSNMEARYRRCAEARSRIMRICFGGGNDTHREEEWKARYEAWECENLWLYWCGKRPPTFDYYAPLACTCGSATNA